MSSNILQDGERIRKMPDGSVITIDRNGNVVDDGEHVRVPMLFMDSAAGFSKSMPTFDAANHRPRTLPMTDSDKARHLAHAKRYEDRLNGAWKNPAPVAAVSSPTPTPAPAQAMRAAAVTADRSIADAAYTRRSRQLEATWKTTT